MVFGIMLLCFVPFQLSNDPEFEEFLDLHKAKSLKNAWSNDTKLGTLDNSEAAKRPEGKMLSFKKRLSVGKVKYFYNNQFIIQKQIPKTKTKTRIQSETLSAISM